MADTIMLQIVGENKMSCGGCERAVMAALRNVRGVENARADHRTQEVEVWTGAIPPSLVQMQQELAEAGYQAELV